MSWKLQSYFEKRIPLVLRKKDNTIYIQSQFDVARKDGLCAGIYVELFELKGDSAYMIGLKALEILDLFLGYSDLTLEQFYAITKLDIEEYDLISGRNILEATGAKDTRDLDLNYSQCCIVYDIKSKKYSFHLDWIEKKGRSYSYESSESTGEPKIVTFDTPLEFYSAISPEELGTMVLEAFQRVEKIEEKVNGKKKVPKEVRKSIDLLENVNLSVIEPRDKHFEDLEDNGVGEHYQLYSYFPKANSESVADFYLGMAAELACDTSPKNIQKTWEEFYGILEFFEMKEVDYGIFNLRVEMKNKKCHRISYLVQMEEDTLLECTMDLSQPGKRKKSDEKLSALFEEFALSCKWQGEKI